MSDDNDEFSARIADPAASGHGNVLRLADFSPEQPARILADLRDYWQGLRQGRAIPNRSDIEPRGIRGALDYAFILERIAPGAARFRLAGRHLIDLMGMEVRGMPICSFLNPRSRGRLSDVIETVFKAPQIAELRLLSPGDYARPELSGRMLLLPLKSDLGDVTRALGCLIAEGDIGMSPRRFDLTGETVSAIFEGAEVMQPSPSSRGFAEDAPIWRAGDKTTPDAKASDAKARDAKAGATNAGDAKAGVQMPAPDAATAGAPRPSTPEQRRAMFRVIGNDI